MDSFKELQDTVSAALVSTTRSATAINRADLPFQRSLNPEVGTALDEQNARLLHLAQRLLENAASSSDAAGPSLPDIDAVDTNWRGVVDVVDSLLEKADTSLDEYSGAVKRATPAGEQTSVKPRANTGSQKFLNKPQLSFEHVPKNNETGGFHPLMTSKPHAKIPLKECVKPFNDKNGREQYPHPYQLEIESYDYPPFMYESCEPQQYSPFETTTATFVDSPESMFTMLAELKTAKEIAIDLEHHENRSYSGLVSLMQISTRQKDWIVDTLKPWRRRLECLNEVFANPNIVKVLHGAYMDIVWLQRDLGLYVVGLFDTYHAARALGYQGASLAFLLEKFIKFKAQKQYQLADWRVRPLPKELFEYARADTHFLLYILDNMRNELIAKSDFSHPEGNKVRDVLNKSKETALQRYQYPIYDTELGLGPVSWYRLISKTPVQFTPQQFAIFKAVHKWRDDVARQEDESPLFVMPNHAVFSIARSAPADKAELFTVTQHVSPVLRIRADEVVDIVARAKKAGTDGPRLDDTLQRITEVLRAERADRMQSSPSVSKVDKTPPKPAVQQAPLTTSLSTSDLRAPKSEFWGNLSADHTAQQRRSASTMLVDLALPLPPLTAEIFEDRNGRAADSPTSLDKQQHKFIPKDERPEEDERTDIFVVKQLGRKRKRAGPEDEQRRPPASALDPMQADEIMLEDSDESSKGNAEQQKKKARADKKAAKKARKSASKGLDYGDEPAFDYAKAPSVLKAQEGEGKRKKDKKNKKKDQGFNPYAKSLDAPKGLPRVQKESAGKSKTFTS